MLTLQVTRSSIDGWTWTIRDASGRIVDAGSGRDSGETRREGESFLRWHRTRLDTGKLGKIGR